MSAQRPLGPMALRERMPRTGQGARDRFETRPLDCTYFADVQRELAVLRDWDKFEHMTNVGREDAKRVLHQCLARDRRLAVR
jgi:hypothetical protein